MDLLFAGSRLLAMVAIGLDLGPAGFSDGD
jgi:hypothetical protein